MEEAGVTVCSLAAAAAEKVDQHLMVPKCSLQLSGPNYTPMQHQLWLPAACLWPFPEGRIEEATQREEADAAEATSDTLGVTNQAFQSIPRTTFIKNQSPLRLWQQALPFSKKK